MRLNKYIASCGVCSRRMADQYIVDNKVMINSKIENNLGRQVDVYKDKVKVDGKLIRLQETKVYIVLNKPLGYVTTAKDEFDRRCVMELIKEKIRVFPVGRLDMYTEGLLLLTNDGEFTNNIIHPKNEITKTYVAVLDKEISDLQIETLKKGVDIGDYVTRPAKLKRISPKSVEIIISEGKNRQVRRMFETQDLNAVKLKRTAIGKLTLDNLKVGEYQKLSKLEMKKYFKFI